MLSPTFQKKKNIMKIHDQISTNFLLQNSWLRFNGTWYKQIIEKQTIQVFAFERTLKVSK